MNKRIYLCTVLSMVFLTAVVSNISAEDTNPSDASAETSTGVKDKLKADRKGVSEAMHEINADAKVAREEERALLQEMKKALDSGDMAKAKELRGQLKSMHQENVKEMHENRKDAKESLKEYNGDVKEARESGELSDRQVNDKLEDVRDRREDLRDRQEDVRDRREDIRDRKEDVWDAKHDGGKKDKMEDIRDQREDVRDSREDVRDHREDVRDRKENHRDRANHGGKKGKK